jgi:uncharacterized protein YbjT (DUF2867 family)
MPSDTTTTFVTGATGFIGRRLTTDLLARGHEVHALARAGSERRVPTGCRVHVGDPLRAESYRDAVPTGCTFVHLVGVAHPSPLKAAQFVDIDLESAREAVAAATHARVRHFVYLSVAQPLPVMRAYVEARAEGERLIRASGLSATFVRPFYVLGPGRRWPLLVLPLYWIFERLPLTCDTARRLRFVTLDQLVETMLDAVEHPADGIRIVTVDDMRRVEPGKRSQRGARGARGDAPPAGPRSGPAA